MHCDVSITGNDYSVLNEHLFPGDGDEHGAILAVSRVDTERGTRLLGQRLFLARDGQDYVAGDRGYRQLRAEFIARCLDFGRANSCGLLMIHNHGGYDEVAFSTTDKASHQRAYPTLVDLAQGQPIGALVFARNAAAGRVWMTAGKPIEVDAVRIVDHSHQYLTPKPTIPPAADARFDRQVRMFGALGQARFAQSKVCVIGLGGVGSLIVQFLAHLGVGSLVLVDPDRIAPSNLSRVVGATRWDTRWPLSADWMPTPIRNFAERHSSLKTNIAKRLVHRINSQTKVLAVPKNIAIDDVAKVCTSSDFLFLAADSMQARLVVNAISQQYLIPGLQIGAKVVPSEDHLPSDAYSVVRWLMPGCGCLWCNGLINTQKLAWEAKTDGEQDDQGYGVQEANPSVLPLNAVGASHAVSRFMSGYLGIQHKPITEDICHYHLSGNSRQDVIRKDPLCPECNSHRRLGRGNSQPLPTLHVSS